MIRLGNKDAVCRQIVAVGRLHAGRDDNIHRWPTISHGGSQFQPVHGTRHIYVGEDRVNVVTELEGPDRIVGIDHSNDVIALGTQRIADV